MEELKKYNLLYKNNVYEKFYFYFNNILYDLSVPWSQIHKVIPQKMHLDIVSRDLYTIENGLIRHCNCNALFMLQRFKRVKSAANVCLLTCCCINYLMAVYSRVCVWKNLLSKLSIHIYPIHKSCNWGMQVDWWLQPCAVRPQFQWYQLAYATEIKVNSIAWLYRKAQPKDSIIYIIFTLHMCSF